MNVLSPMPTGNGAYVLHEQLASRVSGYQMSPYSPWWTLFPPALSAFSSSRAELIHTAADYGLFFKRRSVPLVVTVHNYVCDTFMQPYSSRLQYLHYRTDLRLLTRLSLETTDQAVAVSRFMMDKVRDDLDVSVPMRLIYNGVDEQRFVPVQPDSRAGSSPLRVLFCGNLNRRKRPDLLVPLADALGPGFEIWYTAGLAGSHASPLGAGLRCVGRVLQADMPELYRSVDVLFMPSVREGFGLAVAEAMACGLPVVACAESALPELVVDGEGGWLCGIDDLQCYAQALRRLAADRVSAERMGEFNRARVERMFTLDRMVDEYRQLFEAVLDRDPSVVTR